MSALGLTALLLVAAGGAVGSVLRYLVSVFAVAALGAGFPWGTLAVNVIGSGVIGVLGGLGVQGELRLLLVTGMLGGFTTFSAFSLETGVLAERSLGLAALYVGASLGLGLDALSLGWGLARPLAPARFPIASPCGTAGPASSSMPSGVTATATTPSSTMSSRAARPGARSMMRPRTKGPRSATRATAMRPFSRLVTSTTVPKGRVRCAAMASLGSKRSPLAMRRPLKRAW